MALFRILFLLLFIPLSCVAVDQPRQTPSPLPDCPFAPITTDAAIDFMTHTQYNLELQGNDGSFGRQLTRRQESAPDQPDPLALTKLPPPEIVTKNVPHSLSQRILDQTCYVVNRTCIDPNVQYIETNKSNSDQYAFYAGGVDITALLDLAGNATARLLRAGVNEVVIAMYAPNQSLPLVFSQLIELRRHDADETAPIPANATGVAVIDSANMSYVPESQLGQVPGFMDFSANRHIVNYTDQNTLIKTALFDDTNNLNVLQPRDSLYDRCCLPYNANDTAIVVSSAMRSLVFPVVFRPSVKYGGPFTLQYDIYHPGLASEYDVYDEGALTYFVGLSNELTDANAFWRPPAESQKMSPGGSIDGKKSLDGTECYEAYNGGGQQPGDSAPSFSELYTSLRRSFATYPATENPTYLTTDLSVEIGSLRTSQGGWQVMWHPCNETEIKISDVIGAGTMKPGGDLKQLHDGCIERSGNVGAYQDRFYGGIIRHDINSDPNNRRWCGALEITPLPLVSS